MKKYKFILPLFILILPIKAAAQAAVEKRGFIEQFQLEIVMGMTLVVCLVALMAMIAMLVAMKTMLKSKMAEKGVVEEEQLLKAREGEEGVGFWGLFWNRFNESVPVAKEHQVATSHEYDGIRELDNRLPGWWLYGFYFTILFGVGYLINYHVLGSGALQQEEYEQDMAAAEIQVKEYLASMDNLIDESSVEVSTESSDILAGQEIYDANCAVCHAKDGGGGVGPNFTDKYWIHGGDISSIFKTIKYGVPSKGMISWQAQLSPKKIQQVASYIYTLQGTTPENPKESQGELFERAEEVESPADSTTTVQANVEI